MIPDLAGFRPEWLESAEVSFALAGPQVTGLSFFFQDEAACEEFAAAQSLDGCVMADEKVLRSKFSLLPRYWLKLHYNGRERCGLSQYFDINPALPYPITTIRCFLRSYGCAEVGMIEDLLKPALEAGDTQWGLALKRFPDQLVPRIFFSIKRPLLNEVLPPFVSLGYLSATAAGLYTEREIKLQGSERAFISFDPTFKTLSSLDFCAVPSEQFPGMLAAGLPGTFDYLKMRIPEDSLKPAYTAYMPLRAILDNAS